MGMTPRQKAKLVEIHGVLDREMGDTDPDTAGMTNAEIKDEEPLLWCAREIAALVGPAQSYVRIEQPDRIAPGGVLFFCKGYTGGGNEFGVRLTSEEYERRCIERWGPGKLVETRGIFSFAIDTSVERQCPGCSSSAMCVVGYYADRLALECLECGYRMEWRKPDAAVEVQQ